MCILRVDKCQKITKKLFRNMINKVVTAEIHSDNKTTVSLLSSVVSSLESEPRFFSGKETSELHISANVSVNKREFECWLTITGDKTSIKRSLSHLFCVLDGQIGLDDRIIVSLYDGENDVYISRDHFRWLVR